MIAWSLVVLWAAIAALALREAWAVDRLETWADVCDDAAEQAMREMGEMDMEEFDSTMDAARERLRGTHKGDRW